MSWIGSTYLNLRRCFAYFGRMSALSRVWRSGFSGPDADEVAIIVGSMHCTQPILLRYETALPKACASKDQGVQPFYGQVSNVIGRRNPILIAIALFALGSGVAGASVNSAMLISGRTIQGLGTGGLYVLQDIIICDLISPSERGPYLSAVISTAALGTTIGPVIGGALAQHHWRWIFWMIIPISGVGFIATLLFLRVEYEASPSWRQALSRVDVLGNAIFIPAFISIFFGLIMGGSRFSWSSWRVILPLVLGVLGWILFHVHQASLICKEPSMPPRLFKRRTAAAGFIIIFLGAIILQAIAYFLPIYFQAVKGTSALISGVYFLSFALAIIPAGGITGVLISKTGKYIPLHWFGFATNAIGAGMLSTLDENSLRPAWICYQIIASIGTGVIFTVTLSSTLASLHESDVAVATGTYSFVRSFGLVWGVIMAAVVFSSQVDANLSSIQDPAIRSALKDGQAYSLASGESVAGLSFDTKGEVIKVYVEALRAVRPTVAAVSCLGFCFVFIQTHVPLRKEHKTAFGLSESKKETIPHEKETYNVKSGVKPEVA